MKIFLQKMWMIDLIKKDKNWRQNNYETEWKGGKRDMGKNDSKGKWIKWKEIYNKNILNENTMHWLERKEKKSF